MAKQVIFCDACVQLLEEFHGIHKAPCALDWTAKYTSEAPTSASDADHDLRKLLE
jgi:hypothetical protein